MTIDKPSLAAMLSQAKRDQAIGKDEVPVGRPFILKDPKAIVKEMMKKEAPEASEPSDEDYIQSLLAMSDDETPVEEQLDLPLEDEPMTSDEILKRIMGKR